jgi:hypothetical protein
LANGAGWLTFCSSLMVTDSEPCDTAAGLTVTLLLITTVPVRELMITAPARSPDRPAGSRRSTETRRAA